VQAAPADVLIETFGCEPAPDLIAAYARIHWAGGPKPVWINLEYLSAEAFAERSHGLPSPLQAGPATGWTRHFFYPGFTPATGGLLREEGLATQQRSFDGAAWLAGRGLAPPAGALTVAMFCYEPPALPGLLRQWRRAGLSGRPVHLLVAAGRSAEAVRAALAAPAPPAGARGQTSPEPNGSGHCLLSISYLPLLPQSEFDHLLWASDLNFVRGEDSLVRAVWAGKPLVWQLYPQSDGAHQAKLQAFADRYGMPDAQRRFHALWNAPHSDPMLRSAGLAGSCEPAFMAPWPNWQDAAERSREALLRQPDLASRLVDFVRRKQAGP
jgi:uncharacterized repeat protein (TIGR03837 family)